MLTELIADAQATASAAPAVVDAAAAVTADLAQPSAVDLAKLSTDSATLSAAATTLATSATALAADLALLPQAKLGNKSQAVDLCDAFEQQIDAAGVHPLLQALLCMSLPFVNAELASYGFPPIPTPAFCTAREGRA